MTKTNRYKKGIAKFVEVLGGGKLELTLGIPIKMTKKSLIIEIKTRDGTRENKIWHYISSNNQLTSQKFFLKLWNITVNLLYQFVFTSRFGLF